MRFGLGQLNLTVGDLAGNAERIIACGGAAAKQGCQLLVTPELAVSGYPPQDLLLKDHFVADQLQVLHEVIVPRMPVPALIGFVDRDDAGRRYNAVACVAGGNLKAVVHKTLLPTYDVFDEHRYFVPAAENQPVELGGKRLGVTVATSGRLSRSLLLRARSTSSTCPAPPFTLASGRSGWGFVGVMPKPRVGR